MLIFLSLCVIVLAWAVSGNVWVDLDQLLPLARLPALTALSVDVNLALLPPPPGSLTPQQLNSSVSVTPSALFAREVVARVPTLLTLNGKTLLPSERAAAEALAAERVRVGIDVIMQTQIRTLR